MHVAWETKTVRSMKWEYIYEDRVVCSCSLQYDMQEYCYDRDSCTQAEVQCLQYNRRLSCDQSIKKKLNLEILNLLIQSKSKHSYQTDKVCCGNLYWISYVVFMKSKWVKKEWYEKIQQLSMYMLQDMSEMTIIFELLEIARMF